jgi:hypothetical protein
LGYENHGEGRDGCGLGGGPLPRGSRGARLAPPPMTPMGNVVDLRTRRVKRFEIQALANLIIRECAEKGIVVDYDVRRRIEVFMLARLLANPIMHLDETAGAA